MSAGDLYLTELRAAKEVTPGTAITTMTRRMYLDAVTFNPAVDSEPIRAQTGTRANVVGVRKGPFQVTGSFSTGISPAELIELFQLGVNGTPTVTTPATGTTTRDHTFLPGSLGSATFEYNDSAGIYRIAGNRINTWTLEGGPDTAPTLSGEFFAAGHTTIGSLTGTVTQRTPSYLSGYQGIFEMAPFPATASPTYTRFDDLIMGYSFTFNNNLGRVYTLRNTQNAKRVSVGIIDVSGTLTFDAADAQAASELVNWRTDVKKVLRLTLQAATPIETTLYEQLVLELPGQWTAPDLSGETQGVRSYSFPVQYVLDTDLSACKVTVRCTRTNTAAWTNA